MYSDYHWVKWNTVLSYVNMICIVFLLDSTDLKNIKLVMEIKKLNLVFKDYLLAFCSLITLK